MQDVFGQWEFTGVGQRLNQNVRSMIEDVRDHENTQRKRVNGCGQCSRWQSRPRGKVGVRLLQRQPVHLLIWMLENRSLALGWRYQAYRSRGSLTTGATIAIVEARHASYLNLLDGDLPFPAAFDSPKSPEEILDAASGFIVACE